MNYLFINIIIIVAISLIFLFVIHKEKKSIFYRQSFALNLFIFYLPLILIGVNIFFTLFSNHNYYKFVLIYAVFMTINYIFYSSREKLEEKKREKLVNELRKYLVSSQNLDSNHFKIFLQRRNGSNKPYTFIVVINSNIKNLNLTFEDLKFMHNNLLKAFKDYYIELKFNDVIVKETGYIQTRIMD